MSRPRRKRLGDTVVGRDARGGWVDSQKRTIPERAPSAHLPGLFVARDRTGRRRTAVVAVKAGTLHATLVASPLDCVPDEFSAGVEVELQLQVFAIGVDRLGAEI